MKELSSRNAPRMSCAPSDLVMNRPHRARRVGARGCTTTPNSSAESCSARPMYFPNGAMISISRGFFVHSALMRVASSQDWDSSSLARLRGRGSTTGAVARGFRRKAGNAREDASSRGAQIECAHSEIEPLRDQGSFLHAFDLGLAVTI